MATALDHIEVRYRTSNPVSAWTQLTLGPSESQISISGVTREAGYQIEARAVGKNGAASVWVQQTHTVASASSAWSLLADPNQVAIGPETLIGEAPSSTSGQIECTGFTSANGVTYFPSGSQFITGLSQRTSYYVYVVDPGLTGGDITPYATKDQADFIGRIGYFYIDTVVVPSYTSGLNSGPYYPSNPVEQGNRTTQNPSAAYDGNSTTYATISGQAIGGEQSGTQAIGDCLYEDFPAIALSSVATLSVDAAVAITGTTCEAKIVATIGGVTQTLADLTATTARRMYNSDPIPSGTNIGNVTVEIVASAEFGVGNTAKTARVQIYEIFIS